MRSPQRRANAPLAALAIVGGVALLLALVLIARKPPPAPLVEAPVGEITETSNETPKASTPEPASTQPAEPEPAAAIPVVDRPLGVGDAAPLLEVEWLRGSPRQPGNGGKAYIVEFWATWCGPCIAAMPHLSELQAHHGTEALSVLGVSIDREPTRVVETFLENNAEIMTYDVAHDTRNNASREWMDAAEQRGIPASFVVGRDGRIAWIGHPMSPEFDSIVERVVAGEYDIQSQIRERELQQEQASKAAQIEAEMNELWQNGSTDEAIALIDTLIEAAPSSYAHLAVRKAEILAYEENDPDACIAFSAPLATGAYADDPQTLNSLANIAAGIAGDDEERISKALLIAESALESRGNTDPLALLDHARLLAQLDRRDDALDAITEARAFADDDRIIEMANQLEMQIDGF